MADWRLHYCCRLQDLRYSVALSVNIYNRIRIVHKFKEINEFFLANTSDS